MKPRPGQPQGAVLLAHLVSLAINRAERKGAFPLLEFCYVEIILGFEIRSEQTVSTSRRRGRRAEDVAREDEDGNDEQEDDPYAICDTQAASVQTRLFLRILPTHPGRRAFWRRDVSLAFANRPTLHTAVSARPWEGW